MAEARDFLAALFPDVPAGAAIQLWTLPSKLSTWHETADEAAKAALELCSGADVYVAGGLRKTGLGADVRGKSSDVAALAALWADFDVAGDGHAKKGLPASRTDVDRILESLPLKPSAIVSTGGGVHAWWIFRELWELPTTEENARAQELARGWGETVRQAAARLGFVVDGVHDLARVLRVPGTWNYKGGKRRPVKLEELSDRRFDPSEFEPFLGAPASAVAVKVGSLSLSGDAQPSIEKFQLLCDLDPKFKAAWEGKRPDLPSASEYDLSMANVAVSAGWSDQEIADLLIARRRKMNAELKLREDYYGTTIGKARASYAARNAVTELEAVDPDDPASRDAALAEIRSLTGLPVRRIIAVGEVDAEYQAVLDDGREVSLGPMKTYRLWLTWWQRAYELTRKAPALEPKLAEWRRALAKVQGLIEVREREQASVREEILDLLRTYVGQLSDASGWREGAVTAVVTKCQPFRRGNVVYFALQPFQAHVGIVARERFTRPQLIGKLKAAGARAEDLDVPHGQGRLRRRYWAIPASSIEGTGDVSPAEDKNPPHSPQFPALQKQGLTP